MRSEIFDRTACIVKREKFPELARQEITRTEDCLVIVNQEGETIVITQEFEMILQAASKSRFDK